MFHVKHGADTDHIDAREIRAVLLECGVVATARQCELLARHGEIVREANQTMNLTRITDAESMVRLHIADSLAFLPHVGIPAGLLIDIGSGSGYPGIPLAIMGHTVSLCESVKKKSAFLETATRELGLTVEVCPLRAEELATMMPGVASCVVFRAVSGLASLVELASPLLAPRGRMIALKGPIGDSERSAGLKAARLCGMVHEAEAGYSLPGGEARTVVTFRREGRSQVKLPRRPGMAQRHPLA